MKNWKKAWLAAAIAAVLVVPAAAAAGETRDEGGFYQDHGGAHFHVKHQGLMMMDRVHREMYFTLLSDKYTPEKSREWQEVFAERDRLLKVLKSLAGEVDKNQGKEKWREWKKSHREEMKNWHEQKKALYEEFTAAIHSQDQAKIKAVLPKMLEQSKETNKRLMTKITELKKK